MFRSNRRQAKKWLIALVALLVAMTVLGGCGKKNADEAPKTDDVANSNEVLATYKDNGTITRGEFDTFLNVNGLLNPMYKEFFKDPSLHQYMLFQLIGYKIYASRADDQTKSEAEPMISAQMEQLKMMLGAQEGGLDKQLQDNNVKLEDLENLMKMTFYAITAAEKGVTDDQVKAEYDQMLKEDKHIFDVTTVRHILIMATNPREQKVVRSDEEALARAKEVQEKLKNGGDFDALAKEYSDDEFSKDKGGKFENLDYSGMNQMVPEFRDAAFTLEVNQISEPVKTDYGYHIMRVDSRQQTTLEQNSNGIKAGMAQQQLMEFIETEVPNLIETNNLPSPTPAPSESPAPESGAPEATPSESSKP